MDAKDKNAKVPTMTHQHFRFIAQIIGVGDEHSWRRETALHFAFELARTNPNFDRARFLAACGVEN